MADKKPGLKTVYAVENQEIFANIYRTIFKSDNGFELMGTSHEMEPRVLENTLSSIHPDVVVLGTKTLTYDIVKQIQQIRANLAMAGIVLLFDSYQSLGLKMLRGTVSNNGTGIAVYLKGSIERIEQLLRIIKWVMEGQHIFDPALTGLLLEEKIGNAFLDGLTRREKEVLSLVSEGHTNSSIAELLYIDIKTVRHHINSIYSKLKANGTFNNRHPRVNAARLYLESTGDLIVRSSCDEDEALIDAR